MTSSSSRRHFLRTAGQLAAALPAAQAAPLALSLAGLATLGAHQAAHAQAGGYRALVCLFMAGGNDSHNWLVPTDSAGYTAYAAARRDLAIPQGRLLSLANVNQGSGRALGVPMELQPLKTWYDAGRLAWLANVGPLVRPITKAEYQSQQAVPDKLFSHNDQQSTWQSLSPEGARSGWGGRMADVLMSANAQPVFTAVSAAGNAVFLSGSRVTQYHLSNEGPVSVRALGQPWLMGSTNASAVLSRVLADSGNHAFQSEYVKVVSRGLSAEAMLRDAFRQATVPALPPTEVAFNGGGVAPLEREPLARQLRVVAQMMAAGQRLGMQRQVFLVEMTGFDTHANQMRDQPGLMARVAHSVDYFLNTVSQLGLLNQTLLFSASEFGRTLVSNGDGSDHGWGGHHFVAGGGVRGGTVYGRMPVVALGTADEVGQGRLLPSTSVTELAATLGGWMGVSATDLRTVLPNLGSFSRTSLGFV